MAPPVYILGSSQTDFARHWSRHGEDLADGVRDALRGVLQDAQLDAADIQSIHLANAFAELQCGQAALGSMPATVVPQLIGVPAMRHEAACASGSVAVLAAMSEIEAGRYDCVLVLGVEQERNRSGEDTAQHMAAAAWRGHEPLPGRYHWPWAFGQLRLRYAEQHGLDPRVLAQIAANNFANARRNPRAQARNWQFEARSFAEDDEANPRIEPGMRRNHCAQVTDGAAALLLASRRYAERYVHARGLHLEHLAQILGWGHASADLPLAAKLERAPPGGLWFPEVRKAVDDALRRARCSSLRELDGLELHDCFAISELLLLEHAGLAPPGEGARLVESGDIAFGGRFPVNPSGGLIGGGHPVGASGVRMLADAAKQVTDRAGDYQVPGCRRFGTLNIGGAFATVCSFVVGSP